MHVGTRPVQDERALSRPGTVRSGVQGRMPLAWLGMLAAILTAGTLLPQGAAWLMALVAIILLGVPHGALDGEIARPFLQPRFGGWWFAVFSVPYLSLSGLVLLAWHGAPVATLAIFLSVSVYHFGAEDSDGGFSLELVLRGGLPIAVPVLLHPADTARILGAVAVTPMAMLPAWLSDAALGWAGLGIVGMLGLALRRRWSVLGEVAGLFGMFAMLPPLTAFAIYFVGFHAPRHMAALMADPHRAPRINSLSAAIWRAIPVTGLTLLLGAAIWPFYAGSAPERLLTVTIQGLAALTLPHLLLERLSQHPVMRKASHGGC